MNKPRLKRGAVLESDLRRLTRDERRFPPGTVSFFEPGVGSDFGLPDCFFAGLFPGMFRHWVPCELKRGPSVLKELRPSQRLWHRNSLHLGIPTYGASISLDEDRISIFKLSLIGKKISGDLIETKIGDLGQGEYNLHNVLEIIVRN